jgi:hypothetical protein
LTAFISRRTAKESTSKLNRSLPGLLNRNHRERVSQSKFIIEPNLDMVDAILLKLHAAQHVDVRNIRVQGGEGELELALRYGLLIVAAKNKRFLNKLSGASAPTRPEAKLKEANRERRGRDHSENPDERLLSANLCPHILTSDRRLQIRWDHLGHASMRKPAAENQNSHDKGEGDSIIAKDLHAVTF